ncbi:MAG: hypothetical protein ACKV2T_40540, partial [Kofleriaceae bacterium]
VQRIRGIMTTIVRNALLTLSLGLTAVAYAGEFDVAYDAGNAAFDAKDYAKARAEFLKAYDLRPEPIILYNIAQTYRLEGNSKMAIDYYRRYLAESKDAEDLRKKAEDHVQTLEAIEKKRAEENDKKPDGAVEVPRDKPTGNDTPPPAEPPPSDVQRKRTIPLGSKIAAGVTGVGVIVSIILTKRGIDKEEDLKNNPMATEADAKDVESAQNLINISWGITAAAAISTVVIYFAAPSYATDSKNVAIVPNRDGGFSAAFTTRF